MGFLIESMGLQNFYDIGASDGKHALFVASIAKFTGNVYAFEMQPPRYRAMCDLLETTPKAKGRMHPQLCGLSDHHEGERTVWYNATKLFEKRSDADAFKQAWWRKLKFLLRGEKHRLMIHEAKVMLTSIDHFATTHDARPDLIKMDVDGYEGPVLKGAQDLLATRPPMILLELHRDELMTRFGLTKKQVAVSLFDRGYSALWLTRHSKLEGADVETIGPDHPTFETTSTQMILFY